MNVADWLKQLGLERYEAAFQENDINAVVLPSLTAEDLKDLGIASIGHRRQLLNAIAALRAEPASSVDPKQVPPSQVDASSIGNDVSPSTAERRQVCVMFCDIVGFTRLSSRLDPEDLGAVIRSYQTRVGETVVRFGGFIARYVGDGILIYFGWPEAHEADAEQAVRAALAVVDAVSRSPVRMEPLQVRLGIATGLVVVGEPIGMGEARQQTAIGETPNLAARLQGLAEPNGIVIDAATRRQIGGLFICQDLGAMALKGLPEPVHAWRVVEEIAVESRFEALRGTVMAPLVGREKELDILLRRWGQARTGGGKLVLISGEAGIGKSRLTRAFRDAIIDSPHTELRFYCSPHHQDSALHPFIAHFEHAAGFTRTDSDDARRARLDAVLANAGATNEAATLIAELNSIRTDQHERIQQMSPQTRREKTLAALVAHFAGFAAQQPLLVVYEDLHWIDPTSHELLDLVIGRFDRLPILLLGTFRPEFQPPWIGQPNVTSLVLGRLDRNKTALMIAELAGKDGLPAEIAQEIAERTDGVPLFIEEVTKTIVESGPQAAQALSAIPHSGLSVPATLHASLVARLDRLGLTAKDIAQKAAVIGRAFTYELIACVADRPESELQAALEKLTATGILFARGAPPQSTYLFKHALVQNAAYSTLLRNNRQRLHKRVVTILEHQFPDIVANEPERVARACMDAGQDEKALKYLLQAAEESISKSANPEALSHTEKALKILRGLRHGMQLDAYELRLLLLRGVALQAVHGYGSRDVSDNYARAHELCRTISDAPELIPVLRGLYVNHLMKGNLPAAHDIGAQLLRLADQTDNSGWRLEARFAFGQTLAIHEGDLPRARNILAEGEMLYDLEQHRHHAFLFGQDPGVYCLVVGGWVQYVLGYPDTALDKMRRAIRLSDAVGHPLSQTAARAFTTQLQQWMRRDAAFCEMAAETIEIARSQNLPFFHAWASVGLGWHSVCKGDFKSGRQAIAAAIQAWLAAAGELVVPYLLCLQARAHALAGELEEALAKLVEGFAMAEHNGDRFLLSEMHRLAGQVFESGERLADAEERYRQAIRIAREQQARTWELRSAIDLGRLLIARGDMTEAAALLGPICESFTEALDSPDLVDARAVLAAAKRTS
ncbi:MAG: AAA family ATPase [Rhodopila sp.]